jgi:hypothetical protein
MQFARALLAASAALVFVSLASPVSAQRGGAPRLQASGRASTSVCMQNSCRATDTTGLTILIDYGQVHARGREVWGSLVPLDSVWRLGANTATHLFSKVPLTIGGTAIPSGKYTLHLRPTANGGQLVVNDSLNGWGIPYAPAKERARIEMRSRNLTDNVESLAIALVPNAAGNGGVLTIAWGKREFAVDFVAQLAGGRGVLPGKPW